MKARGWLVMAACAAALAAWGATPAVASGDAKTDTAQAVEKTPSPDEYVAVDELPKILTKVAPKYPDGARKRREEGTVFVQALVSKKGTVVDAMVRAGKGVTPELDHAAMDAVSKWTFEPAKSKGKPVAVWVMVPVKFRLH